MIEKDLKKIREMGSFPGREKLCAKGELLPDVFEQQQRGHCGQSESDEQLQVLESPVSPNEHFHFSL